MRICHINLSKELRGGERQTLSLIESLSDRVEQRAVVRRDSPLHEALDDLKLVNVDVVPVANSPVAALRSSRGMDLLHIHEGRSVTIGALRSILGTPFVVTRRVLKPPKGDIATRWCYRRAKHIATVSKAVARNILSYDAHAPVSTIHDCVRPSERRSARVIEELRSTDGRFVIGNVAELDDKVKGQRLILDVARRLETELPDALFVFVGQGKDESALRTEAERLSNVRFVGWSDHLDAYYSAMDLFVFPSRYEALGSAVLEAMSFGVPVVASSVGGIPEIVESGVNGYLIEPGEANSLADRIIELHDDPALRAQLGRNARATAATFSPDLIADQYYNLYANALYGVSWSWSDLSPKKTHSEPF